MEIAARLERRSLHSELVDLLRGMIIQGVLAPGQKIPEKALCAQFSVSRTPLREALKVLASEGMVVLWPNRGASVHSLTRSEVADLTPILAALEALAGELACSRIRDDEIAAIHILHDQMVEMWQTGDLQSYFQLNQIIHRSIFTAARNTKLSTTYQNLATRLMSARYHANISSQRWAEAVKEHEEILKALKGRDGPRLSELLRTHLCNTLANVEDWLDKKEPVAQPFGM